MAKTPLSKGKKPMQLGTRTGRISLSLLAALISLTATQPLYAQKPSKNAPSAQTPSAKTSGEEARTQANIDTVMAFYKAAMNADFEQARQYVGYYYIEHDPTCEDGIEGLRKALNPSRLGVRKTFDIERLVADGEYVIFDAVLTPAMGPPPPAAATSGGPPTASTTAGPPGGAAPPGGGMPPGAQGNNVPPEFRPTEVAEIFRLLDGKIVEHWKVIQQS